MAFSLFNTDKCSLPTKAQVEEVINGCRGECDKKCVIDNHEIEIVHSGASSESSSVWDTMQCLSARVQDWCRSERVPSIAADDCGDQSARTYKPKKGVAKNSGFP
eukprot:TRINITY_DN78088_c0_g1_i1.p1 TRINITY_DN78088_c0_g1~~TRINITY_DN78088_c0_g1_i1.p1  ORF type:complete len:105 (-),score=18.73 TRINITY_DN78088_c0_g1_i1:103-417(-)